MQASTKKATTVAQNCTCLYMRLPRRSCDQLAGWLVGGLHCHRSSPNRKRREGGQPRKSPPALEVNGHTWPNPCKKHSDPPSRAARRMGASHPRSRRKPAQTTPNHPRPHTSLHRLNARRGPACIPTIVSLTTGWMSNVASRRGPLAFSHTSDIFRPTPLSERQACHC